MPFSTHVPAAGLRPFVAAAHGYRVPAMPGGVHRGLPSGYLTLVVELAGPLRISGLAEPVAAHGVLGGLHTRPALIDASAPQDGVQYSLTPWGACALFGVPAGELGGCAIDLDTVLGSRAGHLVEAMQEAASWSHRFGLLDAALLERLAAAPRRATAAPPEIVQAWRLLAASRGRAPIATVADAVGWGRRHLSERFRLVTGLTPKEMSRVARFQGARGLLMSDHRPALADVAFRAGYADQPHLAREWRSLAGCSVTTWLREEFPFIHDNTGPQPPESPT